MTMPSPLDRRWWQEDADKRAHALWAAHKSVIDVERPRILEAQKLVRLFEEHGRQSFGATLGLAAPRELARVPRNVLRSVVETAHSRLTSVTPRPFYCSEGGDFELRQRLEGLNTAVTGLFLATDADKAARFAELHACLFGTGAIQVVPITHGKRPHVSLQRVYCWEVFVDPLDAMYGSPSTLYKVRWVDRQVLLGMYPRRKVDILRAPREDRVDWATWVRSLADPVRVVEAWHLDEDGEGRHTIAVEGACLKDEVYAAETFPIVFFHYADPITGFWGQGLGQRLMGQQLEVNRLCDMIREIIHRCAAPRTWVEANSKVPSAILDNLIGAIVRYVGVRPVIEAPQALTSEPVAYLEKTVASMYETTGISQYAAASQKPAGLQSGRSLLVYADQQDGRLHEPGEKWLESYLRLGAEMVRAQREVAAADPDAVISFTDPKARETKTLRWADVDVDDANLKLISQPINELPKTPAAKAEALESWFNAKIINLDEYRDAVDLPDLKALAGPARAPRKWIERALQRIIKDGEYSSPEPFMPLPLCVQMGSQYYCQASLDDAPEDRLAMIRQFIQTATDLMAPPEAPPEPAPPPDPSMMPPDGQMPPPDALPPPDGGAPMPEEIAA